MLFALMWLSVFQVFKVYHFGCFAYTKSHIFVLLGTEPMQVFPMATVVKETYLVSARLSDWNNSHRENLHTVSATVRFNRPTN